MPETHRPDIIDCHLHLLDPDRFAYRTDTKYRPAGQEIGTLAQMRAVFAAHNVTRALLVQPTSGYGSDNRALLDALARSQGAWRGIAVVEADISYDALAALKAQGVVGVAYNMPFYAPGYYDAFAGVTEKLVALDMVLDIQFEGDGVFEAAQLLAKTPVRCVIDHAGRPDLAQGLSSKAFRALLALSERAGETAIKISGQHKYAAFPWPFEQADPYLQALMEAFTPERCMWGSDWPFLRVPERVDYATQITIAERLLPDPATRAKVMSRTARRLYWGD
ncbi:2-pyrone-4,6-dicarbaxylate hydrolase [Aquimixticola soesokkakensis]|uniref:2-pyrone-4,6-dicarbaxylate hydrolase n=1 Tax=Aquimixticola soesokkakensis TaxID=1519096 RepID=A0A1Y5T460_9RHOB|nr:amidohydrolase family protein [Aquimixticola soesokkakensis]SLN55586.1 2-pyrone-4,6-dicarbaxylate hydrolase [Aquimixticola soesokkakensis]